MSEKLELKTKTNSKIVTEMFLALLPAQILSSATASIGNIVNGLVVGNFLSDDAMVALGFVTPVTLILSAIASIIGGGGRILFGRNIGKGNKEKLNEVFIDAFTSAILIGLVLSIFSLTCSETIAYIIGARGEFIDVTATYIRGLAIGIIPTLAVPSLMIFLQLSEQANYAFISTIVLAASNLIFGLANVRVFDGGIFGMGLASSASQYAAFIFLLVKFFGEDTIFSFKFEQYNLKDSWFICVLGSPSALAVLLYGLRNVVLNNIAFDAAGDAAVSAMAIVGSAIGPIDAINTGVGAVGVILASLYIGEKDKESLNKTYYAVIKVGVVISVLQMIFIALLGKPICMLFGASGRALEEAYHLFLGFAATKIPYTICLANICILQSLGKINVANIYYLFVAFVAPVGFAKLACPLLGVNAVWTSYPVAEIVGLIVLFVIYFVQNKKYPSPAFKEPLMINEMNLRGVQTNITIKDMSEVVTVSEKVIAFCKENGIDDRRSKFSGLCLEEMTANTIENAVPKGSIIDIFVDIDGQDVILRLRNNAYKFNPLETFSPFDPKDPVKNIGVRMVYNIAKKVNYQSTFGMNVLIIEL